MNSFPKEINKDNKENFNELFKNMVLCLIREDIYNLIISRKDENEYVDLDKYYSKYGKNTKIIDDIILELNQLGWKTKLSFGDTGLFVYSTENPPTSCW
jgi:hypothetical protein